MIHDILKYYISNYYAFIFIVICVSLLLSNVKTINPSIADASKKSIILLTLLSLTSSIEFLLRGYSRSAFEDIGMSPDFAIGVRFILSFINYTLYPFILYIILSPFIADSRKRKIWIIPALINLAIFSTSFITDWIFSIDRNNIFHDGSILGGYLRVTPLIVSSLYGIIIAYHSFRHIRTNNPFEHLILIISVVLTSLGAILESFADLPGTIIYCLTISLAFLLVYIICSNASNDSLTGLYNRMSYYRMSNILRDRITSVISIDMNNLKAINDSEGHLAGDRALEEIADVIKISLKSKFRAFRMGGDEFAVLGKDATADETKEQADIIRNNLDKTKYICAIGYSVKSDEVSTVEMMCSVADRLMYENKSELKNNNLEGDI